MPSTERSKAVLDYKRTMRVHHERLSVPVPPPPGTPKSFIDTVRLEMFKADLRAREEPTVLPDDKSIPPSETAEAESRAREPEIRDKPNSNAITEEIRLRAKKTWRRWPEEQVRDLYRRYRAGNSLAHVVADIWEELGYATEHSCAGALAAQFKKLGLPCRARVLTREDHVEADASETRQVA